MSMTTFDKAQLLWRARDEMAWAAEEMRAARAVLDEVRGDLRWRSPAARVFSGRADELGETALAAAADCDRQADTYLDLGNRMVLQ